MENNDARNPEHAGHDSMYEVVFPAPDVTSGDDQLTLVIAMHGYADAGHGVAASASHLLEALEHRPVVSFANDELIDYRSRRPAVTMRGDAIVEMSDLELNLDVVKDNNGKPFLLLSGPEPDLRWNAFATVVADLAEKYQVSRALSLYAAPMTVPHTRPLGIIAHGNDSEALAGVRKWTQRITIPGSASLRIEFELDRRGVSACGFTAQVPHYVSQSEYPLASLRLLEQVARSSGLDLPLEALSNEADRVAKMLADQTEESQDVAQIVHMLEEQYDEEERHRSMIESNPLLGPDGTMPSADEIGAEFEKFLASQPLSSPTESTTTAESAAENSEAEPHEASVRDSEPGLDLDNESNSNTTDDSEQDRTGFGETLPSEEPGAATEDEPKRPRGWTSWFKF